jgi:hypothetical protein
LAADSRNTLAHVRVHVPRQVLDPIFGDKR